ncbi:MAG: hypothetical protein WCT52_02720 [Candidatus Micrarchaeia archaeon]
MEHDEKDGECCGECDCEKPKSFGDMMVDVSDKAWFAVLQRKIEKIIEKKNGKGMDKVANLTYEYVHSMYAAKMAGKELPKGAAAEFEKKLNAALKSA